MDSGGYRNYLLLIVVRWLVLEIFSLYWNNVKNMLLIFKYIIWYDYCFIYICNDISLIIYFLIFIIFYFCKYCGILYLCKFEFILFFIFECYL